MNAHKIIIDTDPGVDDAMAILYAAIDPAIELVGVTTIFGNVTIEMATRNALALAEFAGLDIPVAQGADKPLKKELEDPSLYVHGPEGFGHMPPLAHKKQAIDEPAHEFICRMINENPGEITLCPIGPVTNIALALQHDPTIVERVKGVTLMGGSIDEGGNVNDYAEANFWQDPEAAEMVFAADWPVTMIGLDATHRIVCSREDFATMQEHAPKHGGFLNFISQFYINFYQGAQGVNGCCMHDVAAVICIANERPFKFEETAINVIVDGKEAGQSVRSTDAKRRKMRFANEHVNAQAVRHKFLNTIKSAE